MKKNIKIIFVILGLLAVLEVFLALSHKHFQKSLHNTGDTNEAFLKQVADINIKDHYRVLILSSGGGEKTLGYNLTQAANNIGWDSVQLMFAQDLHEQIERFNPDFIVSLGDNPYDYPSDYRIYSFIDLPTKRLLSYNHFTFNTEFIKRIKPSIEHSSGFLCGFPGMSVLNKFFTRETGRKFYGIPFYTYVPKSQYQHIEPRKIAHIGYNIDSLRGSDRYKDFFKLLSKDGIIAVYGIKKSWTYLSESWGGFVPNEKVREVLSGNGIVLVLHSSVHLNDNLVSSRIMEAVAASAMVISDRNPAVIEAFGDNVLYIDHTKSAQEIYQQIRTHYDWIQTHPKEVAQMTKANHEVFLRRFTAENGMRDVAKLHEYILTQEKARLP